MDVWRAVLNPLGLVCPSPAGCEGILDWWDRIRELWPSDLRRGGDSLFALVTWQVWKERNSRCFRGEAAVVSGVVTSIRLLASEWVSAGARALGCVLGE